MKMILKVKLNLTPGQNHVSDGLNINCIMLGLLSYKLLFNSHFITQYLIALLQLHNFLYNMRSFLLPAQQIGSNRWERRSECLDSLDRQFQLCLCGY